MTTPRPEGAPGPITREAHEEPKSRWVILVHGGAGDVPAERRATHAEGCAAAAEAGAAVLRVGGTALEAVEAAVRALEDDPRFNAGHGACLDEDGEIALDAAIMDGATLRAGAVAALPPFAHPISIARAALIDGRHVLYAGEGAARFAVAQGFHPSSTAEMRTELAAARWDDVRKKRLDTGWAGGTVGAVARDVHGHLAAATSTGGTVDKRRGRVGDSPIIGAGTYADDTAAAISTTGQGEAFMRAVYAARLADDLARHGDAPGGAHLALERLQAMTARTGGHGGAIVIDASGRAAWARNTPTMSWGLVRADEQGETRGSGA
jgi:beta-aspartyl-peptidase (threonine type)